MARTKAVLGAGARLSDYLSASLLARVYAAYSAESDRRFRLKVTDESGAK